MKVFFDHNMSPALARALNELFKGQHEVICLSDKFGGATKDIDWINDLSREGKWIVISKDRRITKNKTEYNTFRNSKLVGFFLSKGLDKSSVIKQMERILALWQNIEKIADTVEGGAMFELPMKSSKLKKM